MKRRSRHAQIALGLALPGSSTFADYWPGANAESMFHLRQALSTPAFQLVYLWGPAGAGKTHLMHAACNADDERRCAYLPLAEVHEYGPDVLDNTDALDLLCIDDLDVVAGHEAWEHALFDCINRMRERDRKLLFSGRTSLAVLPVARDDLISRLRAGLSCSLQSIEDTRLAEALAFLCARRGMDMTPQVSEYLLRRIPRDMAALVYWVEQLDKASLQAQRRLTVPFVRELLATLEH
ncbi:MAG: DnaA regulatory inactivator Hda [Gammaproteobacteria bacterium]|nr:DnaA regulatory inactivator Hda [Gammaproteobacteria bacterium]